ncbi:MAG: hypothetical protein NZ739_05335 [Verrucomicrobiae bacterium]|nr:hypothetical protein [Verrucomicrobiae bacterium]
MLYDLRHSRLDNLDILLVNTSGKKIMLMSNAGGNMAVTNVTVVFEQLLGPPPDKDPIWSWQTHHFGPSNYGEPVETQLPAASPGPYSTNLFDIVGDNPNGIWALYIYDDNAGATGILLGSWRLEFTFQ